VSTIALIARREFVERVRDRSFLISTGITIAVLVGVVGAGALLAREPSFDLGVVGEEPLVARVREEAGVGGLRLVVHRYASRLDAEAAVRAGDVDAAIEGGALVVRSEPPPELLALVRRAAVMLHAEEVLAGSGVDPARIERALRPPPLAVRALEPRDPRERERAAVAFVGILALYGQLFAYGYWVAAGVVEEKASRVVEVLLSTVRPSELLRGKMLGIGLLGLFQLALIAGTGLAVALLAGALRFPTGALTVIGLVLGWFLLGYAFYAGLFAVAGSIAPRQEDLQATMTPLSILIIGALFVGIQANQDPSGTLALVASLLPPTAPLVMPSRIVLGEAPAWQGLLSVGLMLGATAALVPLATTIYARAVLQPGRVRLRQALWRG
jgi:ABC-2 type transport system permease protein